MNENSDFATRKSWMCDKADGSRFLGRNHGKPHKAEREDRGKREGPRDPKLLVAVRVNGRCLKFVKFTKILKQILFIILSYSLRISL